MANDAPNNDSLKKDIRAQYLANEKDQLEMMLMKDKHETIMALLQAGMSGAKPAAR
jgi:hypothetical protein